MKKKQRGLSFNIKIKKLLGFNYPKQAGLSVGFREEGGANLFLGVVRSEQVPIISEPCRLGLNQHQGVSIGGF